MSTGLVHPDWLAIQLNHVHNLNGIVSIILPQELDKPVALVHSSDTILGHVHIHHGTSLNKELPEKGFVDLLVQSTHVNSGILISLRYWARGHS
jgi:hypothetical protein